MHSTFVSSFLCYVFALHYSKCVDRLLSDCLVFNFGQLISAIIFKDGITLDRIVRVNV